MAPGGWLSVGDWFNVQHFYSLNQHWCLVDKEKLLQTTVSFGVHAKLGLRQLLQTSHVSNYLKPESLVFLTSYQMLNAYSLSRGSS